MTYNQMLLGGLTRKPRIPKVITWIGPIRCGKTVGGALACILRTLWDECNHNGEGTYILGGVTQSSIRRNSLDYWDDICSQFGIPFNEHGGPNPYWEVSNSKWYLFGGAKANSHMALRGLTATAAFLDEGTLLHQDFVQEVQHRLSFPDSKMIITSNADAPFHWLKEQYVDRTDDPDYVSMSSDFDENFHFAQERREFIRTNSANTPMYQRAVENAWVPAAGLIYPINHAHTTTDTPGMEGVVALDAGTAGITAAVLLVKRSDGKVVVAGEYTHNTSKSVAIPDSQHIQRILAKGWKPKAWVVDPSAAPFKVALREQGFHAVNGKNDVLPGIQNVANRLFSGELLIHADCVDTLRSLSAYAWNPTTGMPIKVNDHHADALRYGVMNVMPAFQAIAFHR